MNKAMARSSDISTIPSATVIRARKGLVGFGLRELWQSRELLYFLTWRDIKVRYKQAVLGILWALLVPFLKMVVFSLVFGRLAGIDSEGYPYAIFMYAGLLPWQFFSSALSASGQSVVAGAAIITKVYFPRLILPIASVGAGLIDFAISFLILGGIMAFYGFAPGIQVFLLIPLTLLTILATVSAGVLISALNTAYRDFRFILPFLVQLMMYLTPVIYSVTILPERLQWLLWLNPLTGIIDGYRYAILGRPFDWIPLTISIAMILAILMIGLVVFRRTERFFADIV